MTDFDPSKISVDYYRMFDDNIRLRFYFDNTFVTYDFSVDSYSCFSFPLVSCERVDLFCGCRHMLRCHPKYDRVFFVDLPTCFGYLSRRGNWLTSGSHHTRLSFDFDDLFSVPF